MQLAFDFSSETFAEASKCDRRRAARPPDNKLRPSRHMSRQSNGRLGHYAGLAAEDIVAKALGRHGYEIVERRYRGAFGEIDIVATKAGETVFVEVKKGRSHDAALARVTRKQFERIYASAAVYLEGAKAGPLAPARYDVATVDGVGRVKLHPGILAHF